MLTDAPPLPFVLYSIEVPINVILITSYKFSRRLDRYVKMEPHNYLIWLLTMRYDIMRRDKGMADRLPANLAYNWKLLEDRQ